MSLCGGWNGAIKIAKDNLTSEVRYNLGFLYKVIKRIKLDVDSKWNIKECWDNNRVDKNIRR